MNLRDQYLNAPRPIVASVDVPKWGTVHIRGITQAESETVARIEKTDEVRATFMMIVNAVADDDGRPVFSVDDIPAMRENIPITTAKLITEKMMAAFGVTPEMVAAAKKALPTIPPSDSVSVSPVTSDVPCEN